MMLMRAAVVASLLLCAITFASGQQLLRGIVVDSATFAALPNVSVQVKGKLGGTVTDATGNFSIQASARDTLFLSIVGYNRLELPLYDYEAGVIRMSQKETILPAITILDSRLYSNPYEGLFDEENRKLNKKIPFYYHRSRKDKMKAGFWREEVLRVQTYVDVVINNPSTKEGLMSKYKLSEDEYYEVLTKFNEEHYRVMYFLTTAELTSLINRFFESHAPAK